ncbi:MAG: hypothetical protein SGARI_002990, partial [Bacillariaceae sp.]
MEDTTVYTNAASIINPALYMTTVSSVPRAPSLVIANSEGDEAMDATAINPERLLPLSPQVQAAQAKQMAERDAAKADERNAKKAERDAPHDIHEEGATDAVNEPPLVEATDTDDEPPLVEATAKVVEILTKKAK